MDTSRNGDGVRRRRVNTHKKNTELKGAVKFKDPYKQEGCQKVDPVAPMRCTDRVFA